ncbi:MAG: hypothetical protein ABIH91_04620 [Candidatus Omnitrophota bacterium]
MNTDIDYDALKKKGFLQSKTDGMFTLRTRMLAGNYESRHLDKISEIAKKYAKGLVHLTVRQGIEVPFIQYKDILAVEKELQLAGVKLGTSGPRLRTITVCPGNNWCKRGLVNTFELAERMERELGIICGMELPHKFKIAISGCPNTCTKAQGSEVGVHGVVDTSNKSIGYAIYIGGCGGRAPRVGFKLDKVFTTNEMLGIIEKVINFFRSKAKPRQRLGTLIDEFGKDKFLSEIL